VSDNDEYSERRGDFYERGGRSRDYQDRSSDDGGQDRGSRERPMRRRGRRRKEDFFVANNLVPDYKDVDTLRRFLTDRAKIRPRRQTGLNSKNQRLLSRQIKRARHLALLPFTDEHQRS
jgi:small subunit ribosomal protein S18